MNDYGMIIETGTLRIQRLLPGPLKRVWAYLIESDKRASWLAAGEMPMQVGAKIELLFCNADLAGEDEKPRQNTNPVPVNRPDGAYHLHSATAPGELYLGRNRGSPPF